VAQDQPLRLPLAQPQLPTANVARREDRDALSTASKESAIRPLIVNNTTGISPDAESLRLPRKRFVPKSTEDRVGFILAGEDRHRVVFVLIQGSFRPVEISERVSIDLARVSRAIRQLRTAGIVERANSISGKGAMWRLTDSARELERGITGHRFPSRPKRRFNSPLQNAEAVARTGVLRGESSGARTS
jgi:DNA-binding MarR family transcriptional regulator